MDLLLSIILIVVLVACVVIIRAALILKGIRNGNNNNNNNALQTSRSAPIKTLVVLGSGGHTTEMLHLLKNLSPEHYTPLIYVIATTDTTSLKRVTAFAGRQPDKIWKIPRSREVGQSYVTSIGTTIWSLLHAFWIVLRVRPGLLLCNGPGTCLPIAIVTFLYKVLGICEGKIVFIESFCRVTSLSLTGRILYQMVDLFIVHWEQLLEKYPKSRLVTTFVPRAKHSEKQQ